MVESAILNTMEPGELLFGFRFRVERNVFYRHNIAPLLVEPDSRKYQIAVGFDLFRQTPFRSGGDRPIS